MHVDHGYVSRSYGSSDSLTASVKEVPNYNGVNMNLIMQVFAKTMIK